jgi:hypothetical protein
VVYRKRKCRKRHSGWRRYLDPQAGAKLYSIEAIDFDLAEKKKEDAGTLTAINP